MTRLAEHMTLKTVGAPLLIGTHGGVAILSKHMWPLTSLSIPPVEDMEVIGVELPLHVNSSIQVIPLYITATVYEVKLAKWLDDMLLMLDPDIATIVGGDFDINYLKFGDDSPVKKIMHSHNF